jgi:hypothetical protein
MANRTLLMALAIAAVSCNAPDRAPSPGAPAHRLYWHDGLAFGFEVPPGWLEQQEGDALVFSGPRDTTAHFTTLVLQVVDANGRDPSAALEEVRSASTERYPFTWIERRPDFVAGRRAARYVFEVELHESVRRKLGLLIDIDDYLVDLSYAATPELFAIGIPAFEHARSTFRVETRPQAR